MYLCRMKHLQRLTLYAIASVIIFASCNNGINRDTTKKGSSGKTLEVLFVAEKSLYQGDMRPLIDSLFRRPQLGLPQEEPIFDVVNIPISSYKNSEMFRVHRNVILCDVKAENPNKAYRHIDQWSEPQIVFEFAAKDSKSLDSMLRQYAPTIIKDIYRTEHRRMIKAFKGTEGIEVRNAIEKQIGLRLTVSEEFELAKPNNPTEDFVWIRKETKDFGIGVLVQVMPYREESVFEQSHILDMLDTMMRRHVPGSAENSYMGTERRMDNYTQTIDFEGSPYCVETRGCWRTYGDFMGGPYVNYTLLSPDKKQVITLTGYVYYPSGRLKSVTKRDLLMQVEGICHSLEMGGASK